MVTCGRCQAKAFIPGDLPPFATVPCTKCGHPLMLPVHLHNFEVRGAVASGGMATVFRAYDMKLKRAVALKMMKKEMTSDPEVVQAFYREAQASAALNHTNIIHIYGFDEWEKQPYIVMEMADQGSVDSRIETEGRMPELAVLDVAIKIGSALATALKHDMIHRDIKPGNILYNADGEPKLADFGLARAASAEHTVEEYVWGTPQYLAPEKMQRQPETFLSDMYSLGATLYHAVTGHVAFPAATDGEAAAAHVSTPLTPPNLVVPEITQGTSDAIARTMAKKPAERFASYDEFIYEFEMARSYLLRQQAQAEEHQAHPSKGWWKK